MGDPVSEHAHYLTVEGAESNELLLVQQGRIEHLGLLGFARRSNRPGDAERRPAPDRWGGLWRALTALGRAA